jgi:hypothetical protein
MAEVRSKDLYGGRYRVFSDGRLMNVASGKDIGRVKDDVESIEVKMAPVQGGAKVYSQLKKVVYEAFVKPLDKRGVILHVNGDWRDCSVDNIYIKGEVDERVMAANRSKYPAPEFAFGPHPFTRYVAKMTGEVWNAMTGEELEGREGTQGAVIIKLMNDDPSKGEKTTPKARFAYGCFHRDLDMSNKKKEVYRKADSIDDKDMNISCFTVGTAKDRLKAARARDATIAQRGGQTRSKPVEVVEGNAVVDTYSGFRVAAKELGIANPVLLDLIRNGTPRDGRIYRYGFKELDVPEAWYKLMDTEVLDWAPISIKSVAGMYVSDAGRVVSPLGYMFAGDAEKQNGYKAFGYNGLTHSFHTLVCFAFNGHPPSPKHTADHRNRNIIDNRAVNFRWATKEGQTSNMASNINVVATCMDTGATTEYISRSAAARDVEVCDATIRKACLKGAVCKGRTWTESPNGGPDPELEGPVSCDPGVAIPVDYDFVRRLVQTAGEVDEV